MAEWIALSGPSALPPSRVAADGTAVDPEVITHSHIGTILAVTGTGHRRVLAVLTPLEEAGRSGGCR